MWISNIFLFCCISIFNMFCFHTSPFFFPFAFQATKFSNYHCKLGVQSWSLHHTTWCDLGHVGCQFQHLISGRCDKHDYLSLGLTSSQNLSLSLSLYIYIYIYEAKMLKTIIIIVGHNPNNFTTQTNIVDYCRSWNNDNFKFL